jgi:hypothetical protein
MHDNDKSSLFTPKKVMLLCSCGVTDWNFEKNPVIVEKTTRPPTIGQTQSAFLRRGAHSSCVFKQKTCKIFSAENI